MSSFYKPFVEDIDGFLLRHYKIYILKYFLSLHEYMYVCSNNVIGKSNSYKKTLNKYLSNDLENKNGNFYGELKDL